MASNQLISTQHEPATSADQERCVEEFKPRNYQDEIFKSCIERNTIVYLPTGAGKTCIAIMALKHFAKPLEKTISEGGKRSVFLTVSKALALQQAEVIQKMVPLKIRVYTGDMMNPHAWNREQWTKEFDEAQVIVATVQIVLDIVIDNYIKISNFNLMIFDECHNAQGAAPMAALMSQFSKYSDNEHPRVIGLTGTLTAPSVKPINVIDDLKQLEARFRATIKTAHGELHNDVLAYSTCAKEKVIAYKTNPDAEFQEIFSDILENMKKTINEWPLSDRDSKRQLNVGKIFEPYCNDFEYHFKNLGRYGGGLANLATIVGLEVKKRGASTAAIKRISSALITTFEQIQHMIVTKLSDSNIHDLTSGHTDPSAILINSSSQVQSLLIFIQKTLMEKKDMKGLIFVKRRFTARILCHVIRRYFDTKENAHLNVCVDFMVGHNGPNVSDSIETIISNQNNKKVLDKFRRGLINLIVATSVLEEGIDLQDCNMVICYDIPETCRAYVQSKGRARMKDSIFAIMAPTNEVAELERKKAEWDAVGKILEEYLVNRAVDRPPPDQNDIDKINELKFDESFETKSGVTCNYGRANQFLNQYCAGLSKDRFIDLMPQWENVSENESINEDFIVKITLPMQSPVTEEFISKPMPSLKLARRCASYRAVKKLYDCGELTENLEPVNREERLLQRFGDVYFKTWTNFKQDSPDAGTKQNHRIHDIIIPAPLKDSMPKVNVQLYLYELLIQPNFEVSESQMDSENIRIFHQLLKKTQSYGILTTKKLPRMSLMKFYQSFGEILCQVAYEPVEIALSNPYKLQNLKRFHCVLFRNILNIWKEFLVYDHTDSVIIVPTLNGNIDWRIVERFQTWSEVQPKPIAKREAEKYDKIDWEHSVVCPWYRANTSVRYVVTKIASDMTPNSPFPDDLQKFQNFAEYTTTMYPSVERIVNPRQFLIRVKPLTLNLNRLNAGDGEHGQRRAAQTRTVSEYLIPELCHNFRYPGVLWLKAILLPSALHRITYILHAESLRVQINEYIGLNIESYDPKPLIIEMARKERSCAESSINNPITHPRIEDSAAQELAINDIVRFDEQHIGISDAEPIDIERNFDIVNETDIEYYLANLQINNEHDSAMRSMMNILSPTQFQRNVPVLCDISDLDKIRISLLSIKLNEPLNRGVEQHEMLAAITSASAADVFHNELLEVLGDAFLKFSISLYLIRCHNDWNEGELTTFKGQMVGNRNLCYKAIQHGITGMMNTPSTSNNRPMTSQNFNPKENWQPPMLKVHDLIQEHMKDLKIRPDILNDLVLTEDEVENGQPTDDKLYDFLHKFLTEPETTYESTSLLSFLGLRRIADKTCADCIEAILGTCVKTVGIERTFKVLEFFEIIPRNDDVDVTPRNDVVDEVTKMLQIKLRSPRIRADISDDDVDSVLINYKTLEKSIGYTFTERAYLLQALTHPSYPKNRVTGCYQQLEFLGDAVLDFLITAFITERCPLMDPGQITDLRSALVNNATLACLCVRYNIHVHILYQDAMLNETIKRFVDFQQKQNHEVGDHVELLVNESDVDCYMAEYTDIPKALGDVFEAIIGGIFLDSGNDLEKTWLVIYRLMKNELDKFMVNVPKQLVRRLYEYPNANPEFGEPIVNGNMVCVNVCFTCNGKICSVNGIGVNKKNAKKAAAKLALLKLTRS